MTEPSFWAVIPAAGVGKRMGSAVPKQYLSLNDRPVIDHTIERLLLHPLIDGLYVALGEEDGYWQQTEFASHPDLVRVTGGTERCHSVMNALDALAARAHVDDWVLVHDAARPCIRRDDIDHLVETVRSHPVGGLLGMPVRDTMKRTQSTNDIEATVERENLWHAYTPQMFRLGVLHESMQKALAAGFLVTDEASAIEFAGFQPLMVEGHSDNLKVTRPDDLSLAGFFLAQQAEGAL